MEIIKIDFNEYMKREDDFVVEIIIPFDLDELFLLLESGFIDEIEGYGENYINLHIHTKSKSIIKNVRKLFDKTYNFKVGNDITRDVYLFDNFKMNNDGTCEIKVNALSYVICKYFNAKMRGNETKEELELIFGILKYRIDKYEAYNKKTKKSFKEMYREYLQSDIWKEKRDRAIKRADNKCQLCASNDKVLNVHHNTYENIDLENNVFNEKESDLIVLCGSCHKKFHNK